MTGLKLDLHTFNLLWLCITIVAFLINLPRPVKAEEFHNEPNAAQGQEGDDDNHCDNEQGKRRWQRKRA